MRRLLRLSFVVFQAIWLNAIVPGHTRGVIVVPGCCAAAEAPSAPTPHNCCRGEKPQPTSQDRASHCAICFFAAHLLHAMPPDLTLLPLALLRRSSPSWTCPFVAADPILTCHQRGPPSAA